MLSTHECIVLSKVDGSLDVGAGGRLSVAAAAGGGVRKNGWGGREGGRPQGADGQPIATTQKYHRVGGMKTRSARK